MIFGIHLSASCYYFELENELMNIVRTLYHDVSYYFSSYWEKYQKMSVTRTIFGSFSITFDEAAGQVEKRVGSKVPTRYESATGTWRARVEIKIITRRRNNAFSVPNRLGICKAYVLLFRVAGTIMQNDGHNCVSYSRLTNALYGNDAANAAHEIASSNLFSQT